MMQQHRYQISALGEQALLIDFGNTIDPELNQKVIDLFHYLQKRPIAFMKEVVPAYSSLALYYDVAGIYQQHALSKRTAFDIMKEETTRFLLQNIPASKKQNAFIKIPVCYDEVFGPDLSLISREKNISLEKIIELHCSQSYRVYMIGFLPGFPYMGLIDEAIAMNRKPQPRKSVAAGSVGIAGRQTGIYPQNSPGGWQIIGRTPLHLFDSSNEDPSLLSAGDEVQFYSISKTKYDNWPS